MEYLYAMGISYLLLNRFTIYEFLPSTHTGVIH